MKISINNEKDLIEFVNRPDVSKEDALKVAENCFEIISNLNIPKCPDSKLLYTKADIIEKIKDSPPDLWVIKLPDIGNRKL